MGRIGIELTLTIRPELPTMLTHHRWYTQIIPNMIRGCGRSRTCVNLSHPKGGLCSRTDQPFCLCKSNLLPIMDIPIVWIEGMRWDLNPHLKVWLPFTPRILYIVAEHLHSYLLAPSRQEFARCVILHTSVFLVCLHGSQCRQSAMSMN